MFLFLIVIPRWTFLKFNSHPLTPLPRPLIAWPAINRIIQWKSKKMHRICYCIICFILMENIAFHPPSRLLPRFLIMGNKNIEFHSTAARAYRQREVNVQLWDYNSCHNTLKWTDTYQKWQLKCAVEKGKFVLHFLRNCLRRMPEKNERRLFVCKEGMLSSPFHL